MSERGSRGRILRGEWWPCRRDAPACMSRVNEYPCTCPRWLAAERQRAIATGETIDDPRDIERVERNKAWLAANPQRFAFVVDLREQRQKLRERLEEGDRLRAEEFRPPRC